MTSCAGCGGSGRPIGSVLLLVPVLLGGLGAAAIAVSKGRSISVPVVVAISVVFLLLLGALATFGWRLMKGRACPGCGRTLPG